MILGKKINRIGQREICLSAFSISFFKSLSLFAFCLFCLSPGLVRAGLFFLPAIGYCRIPQAGALGKYLLTQIDEPLLQRAQNSGFEVGIGHTTKPLLRLQQGFCGAPDWIRTNDTRRRRPVLYPTELRVRILFFRTILTVRLFLL